MVWPGSCLHAGHPLMKVRAAPKQPLAEMADVAPGATGAPSLRKTFSLFFGAVKAYKLVRSFCACTQANR